MNKKNKNKISNEIREKLNDLDRLNPVPEALSKENIEKLLNNTSQNDEIIQIDTRRPSNKKIALRFVAIAAALAIIFSGGGQLLKLFNRDLPTDQSGAILPINAEPPKTFNSYEEIYEYYDSYEEYSGIFFDTGGLGGDFSSPNSINYDEKQNAVEEKNYSETNLQVPGVDEADIVKTDGKSIYSAYNLWCHEGDKYDEKVDNYTELKNFYKEDYQGEFAYLRIIDAQENGAMEEAAMLYFTDVKPLEFGGNAKISRRYVAEFFIRNDVLYVLLCEEYELPPGGTSALSYPTYRYVSRLISYDVSDPTEPHITNSFAQDGFYISSRIADGNLIMLTSFRDAFDGNKELPSIYKNGIREKIPYNNIYIAKTGIETKLVISSQSLDNDEEISVVAFVGKDTAAETVYCDGESIYFANDYYNIDSELKERFEAAEEAYNEYIYDDVPSEIDEEFSKMFSVAREVWLTQVIRFDLKDNDIVYGASGVVRGRTLNQFSMDAYNGYFRVATTGYNGNAVYVLDGELKTIGTLEGLAKSEELKAVRFMGDTAYLVTFEHIDPLFVIDLTNPAEPKALGELKITGFSEYLHPVGEKLLMGVGSEITDDVRGAKVTLFDVSDPYNPKDIKSYVYENDFVADRSHKAFLVIKTKDTYAIITRHEETTQENGSRFSLYLRTYTLDGRDLAEGRSFELELPEDDTDWTGRVPRAVYIGDTIYIIHRWQAAAFDMNTGELLSEIG